jgi:hypothetical protein
MLGHLSNLIQDLFQEQNVDLREAIAAMKRYYLMIFPGPIAEIERMRGF